MRVKETDAGVTKEIEPSIDKVYVPTGIEVDHEYCLVKGLKVKLEGTVVETSE